MFGDRLKLLRTSKGYSMDRLAELYNKKFDGRLNKSTISRYENGLQEPIFTTVKNFAELFDVSTDYLTDTNDYPGRINKSQLPSIPSPSEVDPDASAFKMYKKLDTVDKAEIRGEMKNMLKADKYKKENIENDTEFAKGFDIAASGGAFIQSGDDDFETL